MRSTSLTMEKKLTLLKGGTCQIRKVLGGERMHAEVDLQKRLQYLAISTDNTVLFSTCYFQTKTLMKYQYIHFPHSV